MDKKSIIILILIGVVIFVAGGGMGISYQGQKTNTRFRETEDLFRKMTLEGFFSITVNGNLSKIEGEKLFLSREGEDIEIKISDNIKTYYYLRTSPDTIKEITIRDLKIGDELNATIGVREDGKIEGISVAVPIDQ